MFENAEINLMEQQLIFLLDFDLRFNEEQALEHFAPFMPHRVTSPQQDKETRQSAVNRLKARRSRSYINVQNAQMPLTPPYDAVPPSMVPSKSASGHLDVPSSSSHAQLPTPARSPSSSASSPAQEMSSSRTVDSQLSMGGLTEDNSSSGSEMEDNEEDNVIAIPPRSAMSSRISFILPPKPPPARRSQMRSTSCQVDSNYQRRETQHEGRSQMQSSITMSSIPRIRESMSSGFLSRMFGSAKDKSDQATRIEKDKSGIDNNCMQGRSDVLIASESSAVLDHKAIRPNSQMFRSQRYPAYELVVDNVST